MPTLTRYQRKQLSQVASCALLILIGAVTNIGWVRAGCFSAALVGMFVFQLTSDDLAARNDPVSHDERRQAIALRAQAVAYPWTAIALVAALVVSNLQKRPTGFLLAVFAVASIAPIASGAWFNRSS